MKITFLLRRYIINYLFTFKEFITWWWLSKIKKISDGRKKELNSVCLFLGPYRNLTTLISSILFLHPHCQVLNHAGNRVFNNKNINFLLNYSDDKFDKFCQFVFFASQCGRVGDYGGSIIHSHAFKIPVMRETYNNNKSTLISKQKINAIIWKESLRTSNFIRKNNIDLGDIINKNKKIRFLMPVRNPIDCAISNLNNKHHKLFEDLKDYSVECILISIFKEYLWFLGLEKKYPERFMHFFQD